jgi:hypothetical protein
MPRASPIFSSLDMAKQLEREQLEREQLELELEQREQLAQDIQRIEVPEGKKPRFGYEDHLWTPNDYDFSTWSLKDENYNIWQLVDDVRFVSGDAKPQAPHAKELNYKWKSAGWLSKSNSTKREKKLTEILELIFDYQTRSFEGPALASDAMIAKALQLTNGDRTAAAQMLL